MMVMHNVLIVNDMHNVVKLLIYKAEISSCCRYTVLVRLCFFWNSYLLSALYIYAKNGISCWFLFFCYYEHISYY